MSRILSTLGFVFSHIGLVSCVCMCGHFFIPRILASLRSQLRSQNTTDADSFIVGVSLSPTNLWLWAEKT